MSKKLPSTSPNIINSFLIAIEVRWLSSPSSGKILPPSLIILFSTEKLYIKPLISMHTKFSFCIEFKALVSDSFAAISLPCFEFKVSWLSGFASFFLRSVEHHSFNLNYHLVRSRYTVL